MEQKWDCTRYMDANNGEFLRRQAAPTDQRGDKEISGQLIFLSFHVVVPTHCRDAASSSGSNPGQSGECTLINCALGVCFPAQLTKTHVRTAYWEGEAPAESMFC